MFGPNLMSIYPEKIADSIREPRSVGRCGPDSIAGKAANFDCGCSVEISVSIEPEEQTLAVVRYRSNGCGFMLAAAETIARLIKGRSLSELHGFESEELISEVEGEIGELPYNRKACAETVIEAVSKAFARHREKRLDEFTGEKALICTCFSVAEEAIAEFIRTASPTTVEEVTAECRAGGGCGACRMLISEMLDSASVYKIE